MQISKLPLFQCHKVVHADVIASIIWGVLAIVLRLKGGQEVTVTKEWMARHKPKPGGYYVVYNDDYASYSPATPFIEGYAPLDGNSKIAIAGSLARQIAKACHEANRAFCQSIGDDSQPAWADAPDWQKESAIAGVEAIMRGEVTSPEESHAGWLAHKEADGWVYGEEKDPEAKTHPCMVPYDQLPEEQRFKDAIFHGIVRSFYAPAE